MWKRIKINGTIETVSSIGIIKAYASKNCYRQASHNSYSYRLEINLYLQLKRRDSVFLFGFPLLQGDLEVTVKPMTVGHLRRWNVLRTFFHSVFDEISQHDDYLALLFPDHSPKVGNGRLYWRLARDIILCSVFRSLKHRYMRF